MRVELIFISETALHMTDPKWKALAAHPPRFCSLVSMGVKYWHWGLFLLIPETACIVLDICKLLVTNGASLCGSQVT